VLNSDTAIPTNHVGVSMAGLEQIGPAGAGIAESYVACQTFDQMAGKLKA
jgi:hypothetical protein